MGTETNSNTGARTMAAKPETQRTEEEDRGQPTPDQRPFDPHFNRPDAPEDEWLTVSRSLRK